MIISAKNLMRYLHTFEFPVPILEENSRNVAIHASRDDLLWYIKAGRVIGRGTRTRVRRLEFMDPLPPLITDEAATSGSCFPIAQDNRTIIRQALSCGFVFQHHENRSAAYLFSPVGAG